MNPKARIAVIVLGIAAAALAAFDLAGIFPAGHLALKISGIIAATIAATIAALKGGLAVLLPLALVAAVGASGCCATTRCYIARAQTGLEAGDPLALKAIGAVCRPRVEAECKGKGEACEAFKKCQTALLAYKNLRKAVGDDLVNLNKILADLGVK